MPDSASNLPDLADVENPVLLLDLRLFSGNPADELKFYKRQLLPLVEHFTNKPDLAWPGFATKDRKKDKAFRDAKAAVMRGTLKIDSTEHHEVLTWLPRIVALADMSLPIILFSSTGRRDLIEPFKDYGNIITTFEKPRLTDLASVAGSAGETRTMVTSSFQKAVAQAREWLRFRTAVGEAIDTQTAKQRTQPSIGETKATHFEIYFDESGSSRDTGFRVAALIAGYRDEPHADALAKSMHDAGISWFNENGNNFIYDKNVSRDPQVVSRWSCQWAAHLADVWLFPLVLWSDPTDRQVASDEFNADSLIQSLVGELLEMSLFILLPTDAQFTYAVYGAQRRIGIPNAEFQLSCALPHGTTSLNVARDWLNKNSVAVPAHVDEALQKFKEQWAVDDSLISYDINTTRCRVLFLSIKGAQDYGGILARAYQTRPWNDPWKRQAMRVRLRFSPLNHENAAALSRKDRPIHIIADLLPGDATWSPAQGASLNASLTMFTGRVNSAPVLVAEGAELSRLLGTCRALDGGDQSLALANAVMLTMEFESHAELLYIAVGHKVAEKVNAFQGQDLTNALHHLSVGQPAGTKALPISRIHIRHQHWTRYPGPDSKNIQVVDAYAKRRILVDFGVAASLVEKNLAEWLVREAVSAKYPPLGIQDIVLMQEDSTTKIFAVVQVDQGAPDLPYRLHSITLPSTLFAKPNLTLSLGQVPVMRLHVLNTYIEWIDASPAFLADKSWSAKQIEAVLDPAQLKKVSPMNAVDAVRITSALTSTDKHWFGDENGNIVLFLNEGGVENGARILKRNINRVPASPEDFDSDGKLLYGQADWPRKTGTYTARPTAKTNTVNPPSDSSRPARVNSAPAPPSNPLSPEVSADKHAQNYPPQSRVPTRQVNEAWLGPVPTSVSSKALTKAVRDSYPGWEPREQWAGGSEKGWWMPLRREGDNVNDLPGSISLLGRQFSVTTKSPDQTV